MSNPKQEILDAKNKLQTPTKQNSVLSPEFLSALTPELVDTLSEAELRRFKSVIEAARELSEGTYSGTSPSAHERT